jgi:hypothetical protein
VRSRIIGERSAVSLSCSRSLALADVTASRPEPTFQTAYSAIGGPNDRRWSAQLRDVIIRVARG